MARGEVMTQLNVGSNLEESQKLVIHWHKMWALEKSKCEFVVEYLNPSDTSFRKMIDNFRSLSKVQQDAFIELTKSLSVFSEVK